MAKQYGFYMDTERCIKCWACEVACKQWNGIEAGTIARRKVHEVESGTFPNVTRTFVSMSCMHCGEPACAKVCPAGAITKRGEDGIVVVDKEKCIGCHYCFFACPFGVPSYRDDDGTMIKCDGCRDRRAMGLEPACAHTCFYNALYAGPLSKLREQAAQLASRGVGGETGASVLVVE